jgi:DNA primase
VGRIPQQFIDGLLSRLDIVEIIEERVPLKQRGKEHVACCPFHSEKTPSFSVSREKQFYHCFGCGAHGNAIGFLMNYVHLSFIEAVQELAGRAGMSIPTSVEAERQHAMLNPLYDTLKAANDFFKEQLHHPRRGSRALKYLAQRHVPTAVMHDFELGYAPPGWRNLLSALGGTPDAQRHLMAAGLIIDQHAGGEPYDRFRDRLMFPIHDRRGRVIAFGGRVLGDGVPKYLNSPETAVFHKRRALYGLFQLQRLARRPPHVLVVEGYMDVLALAQNGFRQAVATLGTAATAEHLEQLFRMTPEVIFCFDGDQAGRTAAWRALEVALPVMEDGRQARYMLLPEEEDPDSLLRSEGADRFADEVRHATSLVTFLFEQLSAQVDIATLEGKARLVALAKPRLMKLPRGALKHLALKRLSELTGVEGYELDALVKRRAAQHPPRKQTQKAMGVSRHQRSPSLVRRTIKLLLHHPHLASAAKDTDFLRELELPGVSLLIELLELLQGHAQLTMGNILDHFGPREEGRHLERLAADEAPVLTEGLEQEFTDCLKRLTQLHAEQRYIHLLEKARRGSLSEAESRLLKHPGQASQGHGQIRQRQ